MKPNEMPKKQDKLKLQIVQGLLAVTPSSWSLKTLSKTEEGKEVVETTKVAFNALRYPLAENVSHDNVERAARRWL